MKKCFLFLFLLLFLKGMSAQQTPAEASIPGNEEGSAADSTVKSLLWEISGNDLKTKSYLFGTIHLIPSEDYFVPAGFVEAIENTSRVVFEIDIAEMTDLTAQISLFSKAFMQNGTRLADLLDEEDYNLVKDHFESQGIPFFLFERIKPMFLASFLSEDLDPQGLQSGDLKSYEMEIYQVALENEIETAGLETVEYQLSIFDSIPYTDQANMLVESLKGSEMADDQYQEMIRLYKDQDVEALFDILSRDSKEMVKYGPLLVNNRNKNWIPLMQEMMGHGPVFFAVGAGHLGGQEGVLQLLKDKGYTLQPVTSSSIKAVKKI